MTVSAAFLPGISLAYGNFLSENDAMRHAHTPAVSVDMRTPEARTPRPAELASPGRTSVVCDGAGDEMWNDDETPEQL